MARSTPGASTTDTFPSLYSTTAIHKGQDLGSRIFDVKFYPYAIAGADHVFAVCTTEEIFVCRLRPSANPPYEVIRWWKDSNESSEYNSIVWTKDTVTQKPLLCLAGASPKQVQILDIETGQCIRSLSGHGKGINALAVSPLSTDLLFSAAEDYTIRIWNLAPGYEAQPCVALFAGEGHRQPILAMSIHTSGRWMLTGGLDTAVCMWSVPSPSELTRFTIEANDHPGPKIVYYPTFYSTEIHHNYVDNVVFYGDLIISRACRDQSGHDNKANEILLWKIDGFDSSSDVPEYPPVPAAGQYTRSAFPHASNSRGFQRLLTFDMPSTDRFYQRFCLYNVPGSRPLLAMGNQLSKIYFWDLQTLEEGHGPGDDEIRRKGKKSKARAKSTNVLNPHGLAGLIGPHREQSIVSGSGEGIITEATTNPPSTTNSGVPDRKWRISDPYLSLAPHRKLNAETSLLRVHFGTTAIAFSPDGLWMITVGDHGMMAFFKREKTQV